MFEANTATPKNPSKSAIIGMYGVRFSIAFRLLKKYPEKDTRRAYARKSSDEKAVKPATRRVILEIVRDDLHTGFYPRTTDEMRPVLGR